MKAFTKLIALLLTFILLFVATGCGEEQDTGDGQNSQTNTGTNNGEAANPYLFAEMKEVNGRQVVYHLGKPYLFNPVHFRYDHLLTYVGGEDADKALEDGMKLIKENGWNAVMIYVNWSRVYDGEKYDFSYLEKQFKLAEKYDLNVHIVWFGSNICGFGGYQKWQTDYDKYPSLKDASGNYVLGTGYAQGKRIPDFSQPIYAEEECEALTKLCEWLYDNDKDRRTVAIQLQDEPDNNEGGYGQWMSQFKVYADYLGKLGEAVKKSKYQMITYVNIMSIGYNETLDGMTYKQRVKYIYDKEYIDFIGYSYYGTSTSPRMKELEQNGNFPVFVGFGTGVWNMPGQTVYSLANGYGVCYYQLITLNSADTGYYSREGEKVAGTIYGTRDGTEILPTTDNYENQREINQIEMLNLNKGINALNSLLAVTAEENMAAFNNKMKNDTTASKTIDDEKIKYTVKTTGKNGGVGFMLKADDGNFYGFSNMDATYTFTSDITVAVGHYDGEKWVSDGEVSVDGKSFKAQAGKAYQVVVK